MAGRGAQLEGAPDGGRPYNSFGREVVKRLLVEDERDLLLGARVRPERGPISICAAISLAAAISMAATSIAAAAACLG